MKTTSILAALCAVAALSACEKTTVNPPATVVTPTAAPAPSTVAVPVAVPGPAGPAGAPGDKGEKGEAGAPGSTTVVVPEKTN